MVVRLGEDFESRLARLAARMKRSIFRAGCRWNFWPASPGQAETSRTGTAALYADAGASMQDGR
jgi:hypothetical protein